MLFNSFEFMFLFLPVAVLGYFLLNGRKLTTAATGWLVLASLFFYCWWNVKYLSLIVGSVLFNFAAGTAIMRQSAVGKHGALRRSMLVAGIAGNVLLLGYYKYTDFFIENLNRLTGLEIALQRIVLPLGISFFTFTQIAFLVDAFKGKAREYDLLRYCLFVTFFPHLLAGPIIHHAEMMPQFSRLRGRVPDYANISRGLFLFFVGLFKKVVIADELAPIASFGFDAAAKLTFTEAWVTSLCYTLQLYFDFSAYTDMALGASRMFNIVLPRNFNSPYQALDIADFWRRWHMTLSRFLRDYIYIPLGGNRAGEAATYRNLIATFLVGGIWHGAGWTFVLWGFLHGAATVVHRAWEKLGIRMHRVPAWLLTFLFVNTAWVFFRAKTWPAAVKVLAGMAGRNGIGVGAPFFRAVNRNTVYLLVAALLVALLARNSDEMADAFRPTGRTLALTAAVAVFALLSMNKVSEFLYFNF